MNYSCLPCARYNYDIGIGDGEASVCCQVGDKAGEAHLGGKNRHSRAVWSLPSSLVEVFDLIEGCADGQICKSIDENSRALDFIIFTQDPIVSGRIASRIAKTHSTTYVHASAD